MCKKNIMKKAIVQGMILALLAMLAQPAASEAKSISIKANKKSVSVSLYVGKSVKLKAAKGKKVSWSSKNKKIAVVKSSGKVTAKSAGNTKIIGKIAGSSQKLTCKVQVGNYITGMKLSSASTVILGIGETSQVKASVVGSKPLDAGFAYSSSDKTIAKVSASGKITAVGGGLTNITVKTNAVNKKGKTYSKKVAVYVEQEQEPVDVPNPSPGSTVVVSGSSVMTDTGITLQEAISQMAPPTENQLLAGSFVVSDGSNTQTIYFLNRNYSGAMQLSVFGYSLSGSRKVADMLDAIADIKSFSTYITSNGERVLLFSDKAGTCAVKNLATQEVVNFQVYATDTVYGTGYGMIVADGDTRDKIQVK